MWDEPKYPSLFSFEINLELFEQALFKTTKASPSDLICQICAFVWRIPRARWVVGAQLINFPIKELEKVRIGPLLAQVHRLRKGIQFPN